MASLRLESGKRNGYRLQFRMDGSMRNLWIGDVAEDVALSWKRHLEHLLAVRRENESPHRPTVQWLATLADVDHDKLSRAGLVDSRTTRQGASMTLGKWIETYITERADVKPSTARFYRRAQTCLLTHFGASRKLRTIAPDDAKRWRVWMLTQGNVRDKNRTTMADETVRRMTGIAKQFFAGAMERQLVTENPFQKLPSTTRGNDARQYFVDVPTITRCIEAAPCEQWRTILALARFAGVRCPSELLGLRWSDVDLPNGRMTIRATKTAHHKTGGARVCPIFPELRPYLEAAWDAAPERTVHVVHQYRGAGVNLRTQFERIILRAGLVPWPRLFQNLRASRETELMAKFPVRDVSAWLGNSVPVAMRHYAMATAQSFIAATQEATVTTSVTTSLGNQEPSGKHQGEAETPENLEKCGLLMAPEGAEREAEKQEKWAIQEATGGWKRPQNAANPRRGRRPWFHRWFHQQTSTAMIRKRSSS